MKKHEQTKQGTTKVAPPAVSGTMPRVFRRCPRRDPRHARPVPRTILACLALALATACSPLSPPAGTGTPPAPPQSSPAPAAGTPAAVPPPPADAPRFVAARIGAIHVNLVDFDSRSHRLRVADQPDGPGSRWPDSRAASRSLGGIAACNGGFFTPEGQPLGLVIAGGQRRGALNTSSLGGGIWLDSPGTPPAILRREAWARSGPANPAELLQSGPFLVANGRPVTGLESGRVRPRTVLARDGGHRWFIATTAPCTLDALARALASSKPAGWPVRQALNLDGGRSSELWVSGSLTGGPLLIRPFWNSPVRNFLVLVPQ